MKGLYVFGTLVGFTAEPWSTDSSKYNYTVGIQTGTYKNQYGQESPNTISLNLTTEQYNNFNRDCQSMIGKDVVLEFAEAMRKGGKSGQWLQHYVPKDAKIVLQGAKS